MPGRILIVEDDPAIRRGIVDAVRFAGYEPVETADGEVRFHKDGYTDLRGRFDYASVSDDPNAGAERYAVLVLDEQLGAVIRDVAPPAR